MPFETYEPVEGNPDAYTWNPLRELVKPIVDPALDLWDAGKRFVTGEEEPPPFVDPPAPFNGDVDMFTDKPSPGEILEPFMRDLVDPSIWAPYVGPLFGEEAPPAMPAPAPGPGRPAPVDIRPMGMFDGLF
jgi:hypothetical protein